MWDNPNVPLPLPIPSPVSREDFPLISGPEPPGGKNAPAETNPLQNLLAESSADELALQLKENLRPVKSDPVEMVSRCMAVLSTMAAELGIILRLQVRTEKISANMDQEKIRRVLNALVVHLLTVSQTAGWVTIGLDKQNINGRRGYSLRLAADSIILPWKSNPEYEEEINTQAELSLCRKIVEKHGGAFTVRFQEDNRLVYSIWLPA